jgi:hypothetical protein
MRDQGIEDKRKKPPRGTKAHEGKRRQGKKRGFGIYQQKPCQPPGKRGLFHEIF